MPFFLNITKLLQYIHSFIILGICVCVFYVCVSAYKAKHVCGDQKTIFKNRFFSSTRWAPGIELRSLGLAASVFTHQALTSYNQTLIL